MDGFANSYYASKDNAVKDVITFEMDSKNTFDCLMVQEVLELGHRTTLWSVDYSNDGKKWSAIPEAKDKQSIGHKWIIRFAPITAKYVRLRITDGKAGAALHTFGVYKQSDLVNK